MKKKRIFYLLTAAVFLLSACSPGGGNAKRGKEMGYFTYPETDWGMTVEEVKSALGLSEKSLTRLENAVDGNESYLAELEIFGAFAEAVFIFNSSVSGAGEPFLSEVRLVYQGSDASDYQTRLDALCDCLDKDSIPYTKSGETLERGEWPEDDSADIVMTSVQTEDELYADGAALTNRSFSVYSNNTVADLPKEIREAADAYAHESSPEAFKDGVSLTESFKDVPLTKASFLFTQTYDKNGSLESEKLTVSFSGTVAMVEKYAEAYAAKQD